MGRSSFLAAMFCMAGCGLLVGGMNLYEWAEFKLYGVRASMASDERLHSRQIGPNERGYKTMNVRYIAAGPTVTVAGKALSSDEARRLDDGEQIPVTYLRHRPQRALTPNDELDSPWGWLVAGSAAAVAFVVGLRLARQPAKPPARRPRVS